MLKTLLATLLLAATTVPAAAGPDFISVTPTAKLAASHGVRPILPSDDVVFLNASAALLDSAQVQIATVAHWMKNNPDENLVLEGHSNSLGSPAYNDELALRRAQAVRSELMARGTSPERIVVVVFGEAGAYAVPSSTDRRVVIYATAASTSSIVKASSQRGQPVVATWTRKGAQLTETHGLSVAAR